MYLFSYFGSLQLKIVKYGIFHFVSGGTGNIHTMSGKLKKTVDDLFTFVVPFVLAMSVIDTLDLALCKDRNMNNTMKQSQSTIKK